MKKISLINYLTHTDLMAVGIYFLPIISLLCLFITNKKIHKSLKECKGSKNSQLFLIFNRLYLLVILIGFFCYIIFNTFPEKENFYKEKKNKNIEINIFGES